MESLCKYCNLVVADDRDRAAVAGEKVRLGLGVEWGEVCVCGEGGGLSCWVHEALDFAPKQRVWCTPAVNAGSVCMVCCC
jgi:hypothetical protein